MQRVWRQIYQTRIKNDFQHEERERAEQVRDVEVKEAAEELQLQNRTVTVNQGKVHQANSKSTKGH